MKDTVRLNFEFPKKDLPYLKMLLAKKGVSLKAFATEMILKAIEEYEDALFDAEACERLKNTKEENWISWDEACRLAGWDDDTA